MNYNFTFVKPQGHCARKPEKVNHAVAVFRNILDVEKAQLKADYACSDWVVLIM